MFLRVNSGNQLCNIFYLVRHFDDVINWSSRGIETGDKAYNDALTLPNTLIYVTTFLYEMHTGSSYSID